MVKIDKLSDVLEVAIRIERNGRDFYNKLKDSTKSSQAKDAFSFLAAEEEKHTGLFRNLLDSVADYQARFNYPGEYELYLQGLASRAMPKFEQLEEILASKDISQVIDVGIDLEIDSILFYSEFLDKFDEIDKEIIKEIIIEEKRHLAKLQYLKDNIKF